MPKTTVNVKESIKKMDASINKLEEGFIDADLSQDEAEEIVTQLEEVVALAEKIKENLPK